MKIGDYDFVQTCSGCPEQYDVYDKDKTVVGYVEMEWSDLRVECPHCGGALVYETRIRVNRPGSFESDKQRRIYLNRIAERIKRHNWKAVCPECGEVHHMDIWSLNELDAHGETTIECAECGQEFTVKDAHGELVVVNGSGGVKV